MEHKQRLADLRTELERQGLAGFIVPRGDEYQGEYVPARAERLSWLTGFTGSAGFAAILKDKAAVFSDGRYTIQLKQQVDSGLYETQNIAKVTVADWLAENLKEGVIGYDPWLHTAAQIEKLEEKGLHLIPVTQNPVDAIWPDQPEAPESPVEAFPEAVAGKSSSKKLEEVAVEIEKSSAHAAILSLPDSIAWLLNIRGSDVPHIPLALSFAFVKADGQMQWFINPARITDEVKSHLSNHVQVIDPASLPDALEALCGEAKASGGTVWIDGKRSAIWFKQQVERSGAEVLNKDDPCIAPKARKNAAEQAGMKAAHIRDGAAMVRFLKWLDEVAAKGGETELSVEARLEEFRRMVPEYRDSSFDTIAGFNANGAIVHYRASEETSLPIKADGLLLVDSGAQYKDGTTDITRTVAVGKPNAEMRERFTLVLKGHIGVASARFPEKTTGAQIDTLARRALWDEGLDYAHGTGHGVGCYLSVHEESSHISPRGMEALAPGMILSNEPGYYKEGEYGIRIENLVLVQEDGRCNETGAAMMNFQTITLAPIDKRLIVKENLSAREVDWLNHYHRKVFETLAPLLDAGEQAWLKEECAPM